MGQLPKWTLLHKTTTTALLNQYVIVQNSTLSSKKSDIAAPIIRRTASHIIGIARNGPLGADGWEMPVLLPEFFGGAHAPRDLDLKSVTSRVVSGRSRSAQAAPRACPASTETDALITGHVDRSRLLSPGRDGVACPAPGERDHNRSRDDRQRRIGRNAGPPRCG